MDVLKIVRDGAMLSLAACAFILLTLRLNPRIWLQDYPKDIQSMVPPKTGREKILSAILGLLFLLLLLAVPIVSTMQARQRFGGESPFLILAGHAFGVVFLFNLADWLILDCLVFCRITPAFVVIPGSEGASGYKDYGFHFRGFLKGTAFSVVAALFISGIVG